MTDEVVLDCKSGAEQLQCNYGILLAGQMPRLNAFAKTSKQPPIRLYLL
jgi:hypothetical protein